MKSNVMKHLALAAAIALVLAPGPALAGSGDAAAKPTAWTGWITDENCGARNANAEGKACALRCAKSGAKLVLFVEEGKSLLGLDDQDTAMKNVGHPVVVTGTLEDGVIKVRTIEPKKG